MMGACSNPRCLRPRPGDSGRCLNCQALLTGALVRHRYEVQQAVGKGGFGITYLVKDQDCFNEERILKELSPRPPSDSDDAEEISMTAERLFKREAQVLLNLQHPGIPKLYAYFIDRDYSYLVQDFIPGHTLSEEIEARNRVFNEQEARDALVEIAEILEYLHSRTPPIVHRDIKPQNLMRHSSGHILLIDFGAVCQAASSTSAASQTLIGSPGYAPPEQIFGHPVPKSDLYAAGATMLRLLTGIPPSQLFNNKTQRMEWESRVRLSPKFAALLNDLLAQDVKKRLGSADELKRRLRDFTAESSPLLPKPPAIQLPKPPAPEKQQEMPELLPTVNFETTNISEKLHPYLSKSPDETGDLSRTPIIFLLRKLYNQQMTGLLTCISDAGVKTIHFEHGSIVFASSSLANERLGELLLWKGIIKPDDIDKARTVMQSKGMRFGAALVSMGRISYDQLKPLIIEQVSNIIYTLFNWTSGRYEVRRECKSEESVKISLSTADIIFEGLRRMENIDLVKSWLGDFTRNLTTTNDPLLLYQAVNLNPKEAFIVSRLDCIMSVEEILSLGGLAEAETLKTLCGLLAVGILEWADNENKQPRSPVAVSNVLSEPQPLPPNIDIQTAASFCYEVENMLRSTNNVGHYAVLGISRGASDDDIREAYTQLARKFHPDRQAQLANYDFSLRTELQKIFSRISEAYRVLSDPLNRSEYDRIFRNTGKTKIPKPDRSRSVESTVNPSPPRQQPQPNNEPHVKRLPERPVVSPIKAEKAPTLIPAMPRPESDSGKNRVLQSLPTSDSGKHRLVQKSRPESESGSDRRQQLEPTPANASTSSSTSRDVGPATAEVWFQKGLEYYNAQQYAQAHRAFQRAAATAPNEARYHFHLARSSAMTAGNQGLPESDAEQEFYKAIELDPKNADYFAELGLFYVKLNMLKDAERMFEQALELEPDNEIALQARRAK